MSFPVSNLLRAKAFLEDWAGVDRLLDPSANLPLREFQDGVAFIQAKRHPTPENVGGAIATVRPWAIDVSSGIETDGSKDEAKMRAFVAAARSGTS